MLARLARLHVDVRRDVARPHAGQRAEGAVGDVRPGPTSVCRVALAEAFLAEPGRRPLLQAVHDDGRDEDRLGVQGGLRPRLRARSHVQRVLPDVVAQVADADDVAARQEGGEDELAGPVGDRAPVGADVRTRAGEGDVGVRERGARGAVGDEAGQEARLRRQLGLRREDVGARGEPVEVEPGPFEEAAEDVLGRRVLGGAEGPVPPDEGGVVGEGEAGDAGEPLQRLVQGRAAHGQRVRPLRTGRLRPRRRPPARQQEEQGAQE